MKKKNAKKKTKKVTAKPKLKRDAKGRLLPGQPALNPKGRPKKDVCISSQMRLVLDQIPELLPDGEENTKKQTWAVIIAHRIITEAAENGGVEFVKTLLDRIEGKVPETLRHGLDEYSPELIEAIKHTFK